MAKLQIAFSIFIGFIVAINSLPLAENTPAEKARYLMSQTEWISIATISTIDNIKGYPFVNVKSTSDGTDGKSTGIPYLLLMDYDLSVIDLHSNGHASVLATFAGGVCKEEGLDAQDPRCPRLILSGHWAKVEDAEEKKFGMQALIEKHPIMTEWEHVHAFYLAKLEIESVIYLGAFGGAEIIDVNDYFAANPSVVLHL